VITIVVALFLEYRFGVIGQDATNRAYSQASLWTAMFFGLIGVTIAVLLKLTPVYTALLAMFFSVTGLLGSRVLEPKRQK
jgi:hypothetical protein